MSMHVLSSCTANRHTSQAYDWQEMGPPPFGLTYSGCWVYVALPLPLLSLICYWGVSAPFSLSWPLRNGRHLRYGRQLTLLSGTFSVRGSRKRTQPHLSGHTHGCRICGKSETRRYATFTPGNHCAYTPERVSPHSYPLPFPAKLLLARPQCFSKDHCDSRSFSPTALSDTAVSEGRYVERFLRFLYVTRCLRCLLLLPGTAALTLREVLRSPLSLAPFMQQYTFKHKYKN